jgi:hypothetical protein
MLGYRGKIGEEMAPDGTSRPSYFVPELDGVTAPDRETVREWADQRDEYDAETAYERHLETDDRYRWEHEQDELRAAFWGGR